LIGFARTAGYDRIRLSSNNSLVASHRLYERLGFQPVPPWEPGGERYSRYYALRISNPDGDRPAGRRSGRCVRRRRHAARADIWGGRSRPASRRCTLGY
jgi:hypothetical protein